MEKKKKPATELTEFMFRTEHMFIVEDICKQYKLSISWIDKNIMSPFQRCKIRMPLAEKESICKVINSVLTKAHQENSNIIRPENELLN